MAGGKDFRSVSRWVQLQGAKVSRITQTLVAALVANYVGCRYTCAPFISLVCLLPPATPLLRVGFFGIFPMCRRGVFRPVVWSHQRWLQMPFLTTHRTVGGDVVKEKEFPAEFSRVTVPSVSQTRCPITLVVGLTLYFTALPMPGDQSGLAREKSTSSIRTGLFQVL